MYVQFIMFIRWRYAKLLHKHSLTKLLLLAFGKAAAAPRPPACLPASLLDCSWLCYLCWCQMMVFIKFILFMKKMAEKSKQMQRKLFFPSCFLRLKTKRYYNLLIWLLMSESCCCCWWIFRVYLNSFSHSGRPSRVHVMERVVLQKACKDPISDNIKEEPIKYRQKINKIQSRLICRGVCSIPSFFLLIFLLFNTRVKRIVINSFVFVFQNKYETQNALRACSLRNTKRL